MDRRHKKKAFIGLGIWLGAIIAVTAFGLTCRFLYPTSQRADALMGFVMITFFVVEYVAYFWGGSHLCKAKGYPTAILLWGVLCWFPQVIVLSVLLFAMPDRRRDPSQSGQRKHRGPEESYISRVVRYRRNALVANVLGVAGVLLSLFFVFVRTGLFEDHQNDQVVGIFIFVPSYIAILYGCWWWVKAKNWPDVIIFIGLMPLAPLVIRYVRILYIQSGLLPLMMVLMPILLIGVVAVLPDKSGIPKRKRWDRK